MGCAHRLKFMALVDREGETYHGWFPGLPGARGAAPSLEALDRRLDDALKRTLADYGERPGGEVVEFWTLRVGNLASRATSAPRPEEPTAA